MIEIFFLHTEREAALAGEHRKGFADEVRKLTEESNRRAAQIVTYTPEIQKDTRNLERLVLAGLDTVEEGRSSSIMQRGTFISILMEVPIQDIITLQGGGAGCLHL